MAWSKAYFMLLLLPLAAPEIIVADAVDGVSTWTLRNNENMTIELQPQETGDYYELTFSSDKDPKPYISFLREFYVTSTLSDDCDSHKGYCEVDVDGNYTITIRHEGHVKMGVMKGCSASPIARASVLPGYPLSIVVGSQGSNNEMQVQLTLKHDLNNFCAPVATSNTAPIVIGVLLTLVAIGVVAFFLWGRRARTMLDVEEGGTEEELNPMTKPPPPSDLQADVYTGPTTHTHNTDPTTHNDSSDSESVEEKTDPKQEEEDTPREREIPPSEEEVVGEEEVEGLEPVEEVCEGEGQGGHRGRSSSESSVDSNA